MSALWTSAEIALATGGAASSAFDVAGVAFDSREVEAGHLFVALKGEETDGHRFVEGAMARGAAGALVESPVGGPHVLVKNTGAALNALGTASRARVDAVIIGVTGSAGKTGTKEALTLALARAQKGPAHCSVKSYNNHTGVPLSLARMPRETRFGVFEMGMNHAGELAELTQLVRPHIAIVTTIASAHRAFFASEADIADAKGEIFQGLESGGTAIIPYDSPHRDRLIAHAKPHAAQIITFGLDPAADVSALEVMPNANGTLVHARLPGAELSFTISQPGAHWVSNALAVTAAVQVAGGDLAAAGLALAELPGIAGRGARHQIKLASGTALLIDESYNANPASMRATLDVLAATGGARRIAVLGEMRELGAESVALHAGLAAPILATKLDFLLLVGAEMEPLAKALAGQVKYVHVPDAKAAEDCILPLLNDGDVILIKVSNGVGLSRLVSTLADRA